jgi:hypothetical protein
MKQFHLLTLGLLLMASKANAQFSKYYAPVSWSTTNTAGATGTVNSATAPASITVNGSNGSNLTNADVSYTIPSIANGVWSFSWTYHSNDVDSPQWDPAFVIIGGTAIQLTNNNGAKDQSGIYTATAVTPGTSIGFRVRSTDNTSGNATLTVSAFSPPGGILPIKLISFTAALTNKDVKLEWQTATETNNDRFEVERSDNNKDFAAITSVKARGNTSTLQQYIAYDKTPLTAVNYYRLKQVDIDGNFTYSPVVAVKPSYRNSTQVYPNPAHNSTTLQWETLSAHKGEAILYNAAGQPVQTRTLNLTAGINRITWNVATLPVGMYYFKIEDTTVPFMIKH